VYGRQAPSLVSGLPPAQLADWEAEKFGAMSGWVSSTPVSITATVTLRLPGLICAALSAPIARRSHWSASRGSLSGVFAEAASVRFAWAAVRYSTAPSSFVPAAVSGAVRVAPADWTPRTVRMVLAKSGFEEWTTITPIRP
jgi:hypothetical protein